MTPPHRPDRAKAEGGNNRGRGCCKREKRPPPPLVALLSLILSLWFPSNPYHFVVLCLPFCFCVLLSVKVEVFWGITTRAPSGRLAEAALGLEPNLLTWTEDKKVRFFRFLFSKALSFSVSVVVDLWLFSAWVRCSSEVSDSFVCSYVASCCFSCLFEALWWIGGWGFGGDFL